MECFGEDWALTQIIPLLVSCQLLDSSGVMLQTYGMVAVTEVMKRERKDRALQNLSERDVLDLEGKGESGDGWVGG